MTERRQWVRGWLASLFILVATIGAARGTEPLSRSSEPPIAQGTVSIYRDPWNVPHIYGRSERAAFFGLGYAYAEDRLVRLMYSILEVRGQLAEKFDAADLPAAHPEHIPSVDEQIESDYQARLWNLREQAESAALRLDPGVSDAYRAFIMGVGEFMATHPRQVRAWMPRDLALADLIAIPQFGLWSGYQAGVGLADCERGGVQINTAASEQPAAHQSNEWALMPQRTATGGAILLSDPHGPIDGRFTYEYRLHGGGLHSAGYSLGPLLLLARNSRVGWALTTGSPDVADCYRIELDPTDPGFYRYGSERRPLLERKITIRVRNAAPREVTSHAAFINNVLSPVVGHVGNAVYVVSTPYLNALEGLHNAVYRMNHATNVAGFEAALRGTAMFPQNLLAADTSGDILYVHAGLVPIRPNRNVNWQVPVSGNDPALAWRGIHGAEDLLNIRSPPDGYLENNNVDPRFMAMRRPPEVDSLPEYLLSEGDIDVRGPSSRATRAIGVLNVTHRMNERAAFALAFDTHIGGVAKWLTLLHVSFQDQPNAMSPTLRSFVNDLQRFDGALDANSTAALKYVYWKEALRQILTPEEVNGISQALLRSASLPADLAEKFRQAAQMGAERLAREPGGFRRRYGDEFRLSGPGKRSWPMSGGTLKPPRSGSAASKTNECLGQEWLCGTALLATGYAGPDDQGHRYAQWGSRIMRLDFYSPAGVRSFSLQNPGSSDDPASPHAADQSALLSGKRMKPMLFDWPQLAPRVRRTERISLTSGSEARDSDSHAHQLSR